MAADTPKFAWPEGKRAAVSLSFDDGRVSQIDAGMPLLDKLGLKATFYLNPPGMMKRLDGWKKMVSAGHEIGNHSVSHACTANYHFKRSLEDFTLAQMEADIDEASAEIRASPNEQVQHFIHAGSVET